MKELKFFLLMGVLTQNSNTMRLVNVIGKKSKTSHSNQGVATLKMT
jgi:hypothetical protein